MAGAGRSLQEALAHRSALSVRGIRNLEAGISRPRPSSLTLLAAALGLTPAEQAELERAGREAAPAHRAGTPGTPGTAGTPGGSGAAAGPGTRTARPAGARIPAALTRFVGRGAESAALRELLGQQRLITVTGPRGCPGGATREAAARAAPATAPAGAARRLTSGWWGVQSM